MRQLHTFPFINSQILSLHCLFLWWQQSNTFYLLMILHAFFTTDQSSILFSFRMLRQLRLSGNQIPMRFEIGSWVTLNLDPNSEWGTESHRYFPNSTQFLWKAHVKGFKFGNNNNLVSRIRVRHAYEPRQLYLDPDLPQPHLCTNCKCL